MPTTVRINFTTTSDREVAYKAAATREGKALSEWIRDCCDGRLERAVQLKLSVPQPRGNPTFVKKKPTRGRPRKPQ